MPRVHQITSVTSATVLRTEGNAYHLVATLPLTPAEADAIEAEARQLAAATRPPAPTTMARAEVARLDQRIAAAAQQVTEARARTTRAVAAHTAALRTGAGLGEAERQLEQAEASLKTLERRHEHLTRLKPDVLAEAVVADEQASQVASAEHVARLQSIIEEAEAELAPSLKRHLAKLARAIRAGQVSGFVSAAQTPTGR